MSPSEQFQFVIDMTSDLLTSSYHLISQYLLWCPHPIYI